MASVRGAEEESHQCPSCLWPTSSHTNLSGKMSIGTAVTSGLVWGKLTTQERSTLREKLGAGSVKLAKGSWLELHDLGENLSQVFGFWGEGLVCLNRVSLCSPGSEISGLCPGC